MRTRSVVLLALALGCGLIAAIGINQVMANRKPEENASGESKKIFVATADISPGDMIIPQSVKLEEWPVGKIPADSLSKVTQIEGRRAKVKIFAGDVLRNNKLFNKGETGHLAPELIPAGYRVVPIETDEVAGGGGLIRPGDRVDVLVHLEKNPHKGIERTSTQTILQDIKVFAVGDVWRVDPGADDDKSLSAKTISLLVTPEQAQKLTMASELGNIRLTLRSLSDSKQTELDPTSPGFMENVAAGGARAAEKLFKPDEDTKKQAGEENGFVKWLDQLAKETKKEPKPVPTMSRVEKPQKWTMRVLSGQDISDVQMERFGDEDGHWVTLGAQMEPPLPTEPAPPTDEPPTTKGLDSEDKEPIDKEPGSEGQTSDADQM